MEKPYHIVSREAATASAALEEFAKANGQILLPLVELIIQARIAVDEVIDNVGRQTIETILNLSAEQGAGARTPGKNSGDIRWHGSQQGRVSLADRQIKVKRPRLRHKREGEVSVPAYTSLQENSATAQRMMGALLRGISTREHLDRIKIPVFSVGGWYDNYVESDLAAIRFILGECDRLHVNARHGLRVYLRVVQRHNFNSGRAQFPHQGLGLDAIP